MNNHPKATAAEIRQRAEQLQADLRAFKAKTAIADYDWYPYESLTALLVVADLLDLIPEELAAALEAGPVADVGCGDGDWGVLFAQAGCEVDAIDHRESNFNQMRGVETLRDALAPSLQVCDIDLDSHMELPRENYGLALFLGTLYHLKNPFQVLEALAASSDWCVVSTRVAQVTPGARTRIAEEPVAYLLGPREANNDPTNFWIFSPAGLTRLLERAGWTVVADKRVGCRTESDPASAEGDERMFALLKSRVRFSELRARTLEGWYRIEEGRYRWTARSFAIEVVLPKNPAREFALRFTVPEVVLAASGTVRLSCRIGDEDAGSITCRRPEGVEFRGRFPEGLAPFRPVRLEFTVESAYQAPGDDRELGVIVPLLNASRRSTERLPLRVS